MRGDIVVSQLNLARDGVVKYYATTSLPRGPYGWGMFCAAPHIGPTGGQCCVNTRRISRHCCYARVELWQHRQLIFRVLLIATRQAIEGCKSLSVGCVIRGLSSWGVMCTPCNRGQCGLLWCWVCQLPCFSKSHALNVIVSAHMWHLCRITYGIWYRQPYTLGLCSLHHHPLSHSPASPFVSPFDTPGPFTPQARRRAGRRC